MQFIVKYRSNVYFQYVAIGFEFTLIQRNSCSEPIPLNFIVRQRTEDILDHDDEKYSQFSEM